MSKRQNPPPKADRKQKTSKKSGRKNKTPAHLAIAGRAKSILGKGTPFPIVEEYKLLRSSVSFAAAVGSDACKIVGLTSPMPSEGKSITCANLALAFAMTNARVLLVDCDLRCPVVASTFRVKSSPGISNLLAGTVPEGVGTIYSVTHNDVKIDVIASGDIPPNPSELLGSARAEEIFRMLAPDYDYIFVDLPPVGMVSDAVAASKWLSGIVMVIRAGETKRDEVRRSLDRLNIADANVLGFVLNGVPRGGGGKYSYKYSAYK